MVENRTRKACKLDHVLGKTIHSYLPEDLELKNNTLIRITSYNFDNYFKHA